MEQNDFMPGSWRLSGMTKEIQGETDEKKRAAKHDQGKLKEAETA